MINFQKRDIFFDEATFLVGGIGFKIRCFTIGEETEFNRVLQTYIGKAATDRKAWFRLIRSCILRYPRKWYQRRKPSLRFIEKKLPLRSKKELFQAILEVNLGLDAEEFFEWIMDKDQKKFKDRFPIYAFSIVEGLKWTPEDFKKATLAQMRFLQEGAQDMMAKREMESMHRKAKNHG